LPAADKLKEKLFAPREISNISVTAEDFPLHFGLPPASTSTKTSFGIEA
jgi:hypothetical protein